MTFKPGKAHHNFKHGLSNSKEYKTWRGMRKRCYLKSMQWYHRYGGRGIRVCERWQEFKNFLEDMGEAPTIKHSLERIDNNQNYEPSNCRWATWKEQERNRCNNRKVTFNGETKTLAEWSEITGMGQTAIASRIDNLNWTIEDALTIPLERRSLPARRQITFRGETKSLSDWAREFGLKPGTVSERIRARGWDIERALTTPPIPPKLRPLC